MANRAYLYTASPDMKRLRDVSEWKSEVPIFYRILLSSNPQEAKSEIWTYEKPIAIKGDFKGGLDNLLGFLELLKKEKSIDADFIQQQIDKTYQFFEQHPDRKGDLFFMEGGEVYDLVGNIDREHTNVFDDVKSIGLYLERQLAAPPASLFDEGLPYWLHQLKNSYKEDLNLYWTHVTYFSFNKTEG